MRQITLQIPTTVDDEAVIRLLRATNHPLEPHIDPKAQVSRVNNRCWRLLHRHNGTLGSFADEDPYAAAIELSNKPLDKPTLESQSTSNTVFSHMSNLSLHKNNYSSHSSMSHIDEEQSDCDSLLGKPEKLTEKTEKGKKPGDNIFFIANSPSPPKDDCGCDKSKQSDEVNVETIDVFPNRPKNLARHDSLFGNANKLDIHDYSSSEMSDAGIEEEEEDSDEDSESIAESDEEFEEEFEEESSLFHLKPSDPSSHHSAQSSTERNGKKTRSGSRKYSKSDDSEWLSISSEEEKAEVTYKPIKFSKRIPPAARQISSDTITIAERPEEELSPPLKPRSLLSGLFLNEMAKQHNLEPPSLRLDSLGLASNGASVSSSMNLNSASRKPILKRSSTTGIITVGQETDKDNKIKVQRPSIMFQKKFTSMTDISRKYPHFHNKTIKNNILNEKLDQNGESSRCAHCDKPNGSEIQVGSEGYESLAKQKSIVGISDFNVVSDTYHTSETNHLNPSSNSNSHLNLNSLAQNGHSNASSSTTSSSITGNLNQSILSSSLNRYSTPTTNSFKHVLSKSSLNLTTLFGSKKYSKYNVSNEKFKRSNASISSENHSSNSGSPSTKSSNIDSSNPDLKHSQELKPDVTPTTIPGLLPPVPTNIPSSNHSGSKKSGDSIEDKGNSKPTASSHGKSHDISTNLEDGAIKMSPNSTRKNMFDSELSLSLKDSIRIDYTLGKVPLPHKIVSSHNPQYHAPENDEFSVDDYHSKGW